MGIDSTPHARGGRRGAAAAVLAACAGLALPATGEAALQTFGSDLSAPASVAHSRQADVAYWQAAFADGRAATVPVQGQIKEIRLKGFADSDKGPGPSQNGGERFFHFQALTPRADGTLQARITSQGFDVPGRHEADANTITTYRPENFCVDPGESIAFNSIGGWDGIANRDPNTGPVGAYPDGTPMRIFASLPTARTSFFTADQGTNNGAPFVPRPGHPFDARGELADTELLMRMTLATGEDRSYECGGPNTYRPADPAPRPRSGGGGAPPGVQKTTIPLKQRVNVSRKGVAGMALFCQPGEKRCAGKVTIFTTDRPTRKRVAIGSRSFSIKPKSTGKLQVKLSKAGFTRFKRARRTLPVTIVAVTDPGTPDHRSTYKVTMRKIGSR